MGVGITKKAKAARVLPRRQCGEWTCVTTKNPTKKTLSKVTMSMKTTMTIVQHWVLRIVLSSFPFSTLQFVCVQGVIWSLRCRCVLLGGVARPFVGLCSKPVLEKKRCNSLFHLRFCQCRIVCIFVRACAFDTARLRGSTLRSFRYCAFSRNPSILLLSRVFVILQSFPDVDPISVFFS